MAKTFILPDVYVPLTAGSLRHRVTINQMTTTRNTFGEAIISWTPFATVWAGVYQRSGSEEFTSQRVAGTVSGKIQIRYLPGVLPGMQVVTSTQTYTIDAVLDPQGDRRMMLLLVSGQAN